MTDLRENLGWVIGSAIAIIAAFLGWFFESGLLNTIIGIAIGAGIAYFVQARTQKRAWKREYSVKIAEQVYGVLFKDIRNIIGSLEKKHYYWLNIGEWGKIQEDHRYFMVDKKFRAKLDQFFQRVEKFSQATVKLWSVILPKIANEETERIFGTAVNEPPRLNITYTEGHRTVSTAPDVIRCLISQTHPVNYALRDNPEITGLQCIVEIKSIEGKATHFHETTDFDKFWESCQNRMKEDRTYKFIIEENDKLLEEARQVRKEITKRIEEPWRI